MRPDSTSHRRLRRYFDYVNFNTTGERPYLTTIYAVALGCLRKTVSRVLVLLISMGYGVTLPYLGAIQQKVHSPGTSLRLKSGICHLLCRLSGNTTAIALSSSLRCSASRQLCMCCSIVQMHVDRGTGHDLLRGGLCAGRHH